MSAVASTEPPSCAVVRRSAFIGGGADQDVLPGAVALDSPCQDGVAWLDQAGGLGQPGSGRRGGGSRTCPGSSPGARRRCGR
jgi:hypothetical protein